MDDARAETLDERVFTEMIGGLGLLAVYLGHRPGILREMAKSGPVTA